MLDFEFFKTLAEYANTNWKCKFTESELYENAMVIFHAFTRAKKVGLREDSELTSTIQNLKEDSDNGDAKAKEFLSRIMSEFEVM